MDRVLQGDEPRPGRNTFQEVMEVGGLHHHGGFKDRNSKVAGEADVFLAMTFGCKNQVRNGGTADTVRKMRGRGISGYHLDLNTMKLWKGAWA